MSSKPLKIAQSGHTDRDAFEGPRNYLLASLLEAILGGLSTAVDFVAGDTAEVGDSFDGILQLLDLLEVIGHGHLGPDFRVLFLLSHFEVCSNVEEASNTKTD